MISNKSNSKGQKINLYRSGGESIEDQNHTNKFYTVAHQPKFSSIHWGVEPSSRKNSGTADEKFSSVDTINFEIKDTLYKRQTQPNNNVGKNDYDQSENYQFLPTSDKYFLREQNFFRDSNKKSETVSINSYIKKARESDKDKTNNT